MFEGDAVEQDDVFRVGRVVSVEGRQVHVAVDKLKNGSHLLFPRRHRPQRRRRQATSRSSKGSRN